MGPSGSAPIADARSWWSLAIVGAIAFFTSMNWPVLFWVWGALVVLLFLRAGLLVLAARGAGADPEEELHKDGSEEPGRAAR